MSINFVVLTSRKWWLIVCAIALAIILTMTLIMVVSALTLTQVDGIWLNAVGTNGPPVCLNINNTASPTDENRIGFGVPGSIPGRDCPNLGDINLQPGFGFDGNHKSIIFEPGASFLLGKFKHYNKQRKVLTNDSAMQQVGLQIGLNFAAPILQTAIDYTIHLTNTPNNPTPENPNCCPDEVTIVNTVPDQNFLINGTQYTLQIIGFISPTLPINECIYDPSKTINKFLTEEDADGTACLFARVIVKSPTLNIKMVSNLSVGILGDTINYTITIANIGDTKLNSVIVNNPALNIINQNIGDLDIGAVQQLTRSYGPITDRDLSGVANTTTATATTPQGVAVGPFTGPSFVPVAALALVKTAYFGQNGGTSCPGSDPVYAGVNAPITYCFGVTNIGSANLINVSVVDNALGLRLTHPELLRPGESTMLSSEVIASNDLLNTAQATATVADTSGIGISGAASPMASDTAQVKLLTIKDLSPKVSTNDVNTARAVVATVVDSQDNPFSTLPVNFVVTGANSAKGKVLPNNGQAIFSYTGTITGTDVIRAWIDLDGDADIAPENIDPGEPFQTTTATWNTVYTIKLAQVAPETFIGLQHTVTASVVNHLNKLASGLDVCFEVKGVHPLIRCRTTEDGLATLTYRGKVIGNDTVTAWVDLSNPGNQDSNEPNDQASISWLPITVISEPTGGNALDIGTKNTIPISIVSARDNSISVQGLTVSFSVTGTNQYRDTKATDPSGKVTFDYIGTNNVVTATAPLMDNIVVWVDLDQNQVPNSDEPQTVLTAGWLPITVAVKGTAVGTDAAATRTITVTVENSQRQRIEQLDVNVGFSVSGGMIVPTRMVRFSGGQVVFIYTSVAPPTNLVQATNSNANPADQKQSAAAQACDQITIWVDLIGNGKFDSGTPQRSAEPMFSKCVKTAVRLVNFEGQPFENGLVLLLWQTAAEIDNAGFNLYRSSFRDGPYTQINSNLIAAHGDSMGSQYAFVDEHVSTLPVYYKLEDIDYNGTSTFHGPIQVPSDPSSDNGLSGSKLYLPLIQR